MHTAPDWSAASRETLANLQSMLRVNSVNPPGNEIGVARFLEGVLAADRIETHVFEPAPGRAAVVARLRGNGSKRPVLLIAHMDVVGVAAHEWSTDPFGAEIRDGYVYGRGAIDDKGMLATNLQTMLLLKRHVVDQGGELSRDVVFVANSDEETGGEFGMGWLIEHHPELVGAEFALNEGGRMRVVGGRLLYAAIQTTEKVPHVVTVTAHGPGGHAAVPLAGNALLRLGRALARISDHREPVVLMPTTREFFATLGQIWPDDDSRAAMADVVSSEPARVAKGATLIERTPVLDALLRNGISATMLHAGIRINVIPTEATATLNVRTLPGQLIDDVIARLGLAIDDSLVDLVVTERGDDAPVSDFQSVMFNAMAESARDLAPSLAVVPYLSTGATDSARLRRWGVQAFGILPFPMEQDDENRMHGNDERVPLTSLDFGMQFTYGAIERVAR